MSRPFEIDGPYRRESLGHRVCNVVMAVLLVGLILALAWGVL